MTLRQTRVGRVGFVTVSLAALSLAWLTVASAQAPQKVDPPAIGAMAPDFDAVGPDGNKVTLSSLRGKIVVLDFWATWSPFCKRSLPHLEKVYQTAKGQGVVVLAVCTSDDRAAYDRFLMENKSLTIGTAYDPAGRDRTKPGSARSKYGFSSIPSTFVIDRDGKLAASISGYSDDDTRIEMALGKLGIKGL